MASQPRLITRCGVIRSSRSRAALEAIRGISESSMSTGGDAGINDHESPLRTWRPETGLQFDTRPPASARHFSTRARSLHPNQLFGSTPTPPPRATPVQPPSASMQASEKTRTESEFEKMERIMTGALAQVASLEKERAQLQADKHSQDAEIAAMKKELSSLKVKLDDLQTRGDEFVAKEVQRQMQPRLAELAAEKSALHEQELLLKNEAQRQVDELKKVDTVRQAAEQATSDLKALRNEDAIWQAKERALQKKHAAKDTALEKQYQDKTVQIQRTYEARFAQVVEKHAQQVERAKRGYAERRATVASYDTFRQAEQATDFPPNSVFIKSLYRLLDEMRLLLADRSLSTVGRLQLQQSMGLLYQQVHQLRLNYAESGKTGHMRRRAIRSSFFPTVDGISGSPPMLQNMADRSQFKELHLALRDATDGAELEDDYARWWRQCGRALRESSWMLSDLRLQQDLLKSSLVLQRLHQAPSKRQHELLSASGFSDGKIVASASATLRQMITDMKSLRAKEALLKKMLALPTETDEAAAKIELQTRILEITKRLIKPFKTLQLQGPPKKEPVRQKSLVPLAERRLASKAKKVMMKAKPGEKKSMRLKKREVALAPRASTKIITNTQKLDSEAQVQAIQSTPTSNETRQNELPTVQAHAELAAKLAAEDGRAAGNLEAQSPKAPAFRIRLSGERRKAKPGSNSSIDDATAVTPATRTIQTPPIAITSGGRQRAGNAGQRVIRIGPSQRTYLTVARSSSQDEGFDDAAAWETCSESDISGISPSRLSSSDFVASPSSAVSAASLVSESGPSSAGRDGDDEDDLPSLQYHIPEEAYTIQSEDGTTQTPAYSFRLYKHADGRDVKLCYHKTLEQAEAAALTLKDEPVLGFDLEWEMYAQAGVHDNKRCVSMLQLASESSCHLFHLALFDGDELISPTLRKILTSSDCIKVGVNIGGDATRLRKCFDFEMQGIFELSHLYRLVTYGAENPGAVNKIMVNLARQVEELLLLPLPKGEVRTGAWSRKLDMVQLEYAATDAYAGLRLFYALEEKRRALDPRPPRPALHELGLPIVLADGSLARNQTRAKRAPVASTTAESDDEQYYDALETQESDEAADSTTVTVKAKPQRQESAEVTLATEWAAEWLLLNKKGLTPAPLRAYHLWHRQGLSLEEVASKLRQPPLLLTTVASYIADAISRGRLEHDIERTKEALQSLPRSMHSRYRSLMARLES